MGRGIFVKHQRIFLLSIQWKSRFNWICFRDPNLLIIKFRPCHTGDSCWGPLSIYPNESYVEITKGKFIKTKTSKRQFLGFTAELLYFPSFDNSFALQTTRCKFTYCTICNRSSSHSQCSP
jgi:hypothetical protein